MSKLADSIPTSDNALDKVHFGPAPEWARAHEAPADVVRKDGDALTQLLIDQQHHRTEQSVYEHRLIRLENLDAVQHLSQWTLDFCPITQEVILHDLTVIRNGERKQYAKPENIRLLNRERQLEAFIVDGIATLLIVLADIRVGDIIDQSMTIITKPRMLADEFFDFYTLPQLTQIGSFHYSIIAPTGELPNWRGSEPMGQPQIESDEANERMSWSLEDVSRFESEPNVPPWYLPPAWLQFSSVDSWDFISSSIAEAWPNSGDETAIDDYIEKVKAEHDDAEAQIEAVLQFLQDNFRYLSLNETFGGQIPTAPDIVLERRYGDCKDLSLLLSVMLTKLGVKARPVIVNNGIGKTLPEMLPSLNLFNHVIVSFFHEDVEYWVDPTISAQGGGPFNRFVGSFAHGLPVDPEGCGLTEQPSPNSQDTYILYDTLLMDSAGGNSLLRIQIIATGCHADNLRRRLQGNGEDGFRQDLIQVTKERYNVQELPDDKPIYEDDREENIWRMVELYELPKLEGAQGRLYGVSLPDALPLNILPYPNGDKRKAPFAIPDNVEIKHVVEIRSPSNRRQSGRSEREEFKGVNFKVDTRLRNTIWKHTVYLKTETDHIMPEDIETYRLRFRKPLQEAGLGMHISKGHGRPRREKDFMSLLPLPGADSAPASGKSNTETPSPDQAKRSTSTRQYGDRPSSSGGSSSSGRRRRSRSRHREESEFGINPWVIGIIIVVVAKVVIFLLRNNL